MSKAAKVEKKPVKQSSSESSESEVEVQPVKKQKVNPADAKKVVKAPEPALLNKKQKAKQASDDSEEDKVVIVQKKAAPAKAAPAKKAKKDSSSEESDDELSKEIATANKKFANGKDNKPAAKSAPVAKAPAKKQASESEESEEEKTVKKAAPAKPAPVVTKAVAKKPAKDSESEESDETPKGKKAAPVVAKKPLAASKKDDTSSESSEAEKKPAPKKAAAPAKGKKPASDSDESEEEVKPKAVAAKGKKAPAKKDSESSSEEEKPKSAPAKKAAPQKMEVEEEEEEKETTNGHAHHDNGQQGSFEVFVKKLAYKATEQDIKQFFSKCGPVTNVKILYEPDGRSKGIAFVEFPTEAAQTAAANLSGTEHMGFALQIEKARGKQDKGNGGKSLFDKPKSERDPNSTTIFVGGLSYSSTEDSIAQFFSSCGDVKGVRIATDRETGDPKGFGHVEFFETSAVDKAIALSGQKCDGRPIRVDFSGAKKEGGGFGGGRGGDRGGRGGGRGGRGRGAPRNEIPQFAGQRVSL